MVGSGLFVLPALAGKELYYGSGGISGSYAGLWLAYLLSGLVVLPGAVSQAEFASTMPTSGGTYIYIERTFGAISGTIAGLGLWASFLLKSAFALIGFSAYIVVIEHTIGIQFDDTSAKFMALFLLVIITMINIRGVGLLKKIQTPILMISVGSLILLCFYAFIGGAASKPMAPLDAAIELVQTTDGWIGLGSAAAYVFVAYAGVIKIAAVAEDVIEPGRNLPLGMFWALGIAMILYSGMAYTMFAVLGGADVGIVEGGVADKAPLYALTETIAGSSAAFIVAILAIFTMSGGGLTGLLASSRFPFAMGRDKLLPPSFEDVHPMFETPHISIYVTAITMALSILFLDVGTVAKLASGFMIMVFVAVNLCVIVLRRVEGEHTWYKPEYRPKTGSWIQIWGITSGIALVALMGSEAFIGAGAAIVGGFGLYYSYGHNHTTTKETPWHSFTSRITGNETERKRAVTAFHAADIEGNNHLNLTEFSAAISSLGWLENKEDIRDCFHNVDLNRDGVVDIDEFLELITTRANEAE